MQRKIDVKQLILAILVCLVTFGVTALAKVFLGIDRASGTDSGVYVTLGDVCIYASVLLLGGPWGALAAALGGALGALVIGSYSYIIGELLITSVMAFFIAAFAKKCNTWPKCFVIALIAEFIMVLLYVVYDCLIAGPYGLIPTLAAMGARMGQALVCGAIGAVILKYLPARRPDAMPEVKRPRVE